jgi:hypothetical protein
MVRPLAGNLRGDRMTSNARSTRDSFKTATGKLRAAIFDVDRTGIIPRPSTARAKAAAWASIVGLYLAGWGDGTYRAFAILLGWVPTPDTWPVGTVASRSQGIVQTLGIVIVALALIWAFRQYAAAQPPRVPLRTSLQAFLLGYVAVSTGFVLTAGIGELIGHPLNQFPVEPIDDPLLAVLNVIDDGMAGPAEELALLALVVIALRATGHSWTVVTIAAIAVRLPFHAYYGWSIIGLAAWAALMVLIYKRTGAILALILEHASWNMLNSAGEIGGVMKALFVVGGVAVIVVFLVRIDRRTPAATPVGTA